MKRILAAIALAAISVVPARADRVELGILDCEVSGGAGFILGSSKTMACTFRAGNRPAEKYTGVVQKFGLDVGVTAGSYVKWIVYGVTADSYAPGALAGDYTGVSAEATAGLGLGANALIGGSERSYALQPVSVQGQRGLNLAVGVTSFRLRAAQG